MVENHSTDFQAYLQSLCTDDTYRDCQDFYTSTDVLNRQRVEQKKSRSRLDLDLLVQTVKPPQQFGQTSEKIERLSVLEGLRKYAANHVLLKGQPGSGKSTALERLLLEEGEKATIDPQAKIPVLVQLRG